MSASDVDFTMDESNIGFLDFMGSSLESAESASVTGLLNTYVVVFVVAFVVTICITPFVRMLAVKGGVVDSPDDARKLHRFPIAYLGGIAVLAGLCAALIYSYLSVGDAPPEYDMVPLGVLLGIFAIAFTGFMDDVWHWDPRLKIAGQLVAAAGLAISDVGVNVATGILTPMFGTPDTVLFEMFGSPVIAGSLYYWTGTFLIAVFVIGGCNAANLIDGLDGLLAGSTAIMSLGFLAIAVLMAVKPDVNGEGLSLAGARIVICFALLGTVLGFLPFNFNPAVIFLGDCGSLLIGYMCVVVILMLGDAGQTHLVIAGLIIFAFPIMDTLLAIIRRKLAGLPMSAPDDGHIHHMLLRGLGSVKKAVFALYGITLLFTIFGVVLAALYIYSVVQGRFVYAAFFVLFSFITAVAVKTARRKQWERVAAASPKSSDPTPASTPVKSTTPVPEGKDSETQESGTDTAAI
jgi:UDP-GlcNAc:undecaprenyl-phosphate GlcNAc-1-phosphate transferase